MTDSTDTTNAGQVDTQAQDTVNTDVASQAAAPAMAETTETAAPIPNATATETADATASDTAAAQPINIAQHKDSFFAIVVSDVEAIPAEVLAKLEAAWKWLESTVESK